MENYFILLGLSFNPVENDVNKINEAINKKMEEWQKDSRNPRKAIIAKEKEAAELRQKYFGPEGEMAKKEEALIAPIQNQIYEAVKQISQQKGYDAVLDRASATSIIFASPRIDISNEVLAKLGYSN